MDYINELKTLLQDITPATEDTVKPQPSDTAVIDASSNPLNPNLLSYCFENILGFTVRHRIAPKVDYVVEFDYKGTLGCAESRKLGFDLTIHSMYRQELLERLGRAKELLSEYYLQCGKTALDQNNFTMYNETCGYMEKLNFYSNRISDLEARLKAQKEEEPIKIHAAMKAGENWTALFNRYSEAAHANHQEQRYAIESYIDTYFSYLEHVLTLLYPFTPQFDQGKSYYAQYIRNPRWTWSKKLSDVGGDALKPFIEPLREIKEIYRNPGAHGMFTRELKVYAQIDGWGRYPMYLGKDYLRGFVDDNPTELNYDRFCEIRALFERVTGALRDTFPIPMIFVESGFQIPVDVNLLTQGITDPAAARRRIDYLYYQLDNQLNMDW